MAKYEKTTATVMSTQVGTAVTGGGKIAYHPIITYRYNVNGNDYVNNTFTQRFVAQMSQGLVQKRLEKHPEGSTLEIFYNVDNPQDSFVQKGMGNTLAGFYIFLGIFVLALLGLVVYAYLQGLI